MRSVQTALVAVLVSLAFLSAPAVSEPGKTLKISGANAKLLDHLGEYKDLEILSITCLESLKALPDSIGALTKLKELKIDNGNGCSMNPALPDSIGNLHSLEKLILYGAQDPHGVGKHLGPQPTERHKFPPSLSDLKNLAYLDLGRNGLDEMPSFIGDLPKLRELDFEWNVKLTAIPGFITNLGELETLKLAGNNLADLPDFLSKLPKLNRITLGNNCNITQSDAKMGDLKRRFRGINFDFEDEYDCPAN
jgi:Leucine-rich repeat (LRR) protein